MMKYDLIIGGAGLFGATLAHYAVVAGKRVLVIENDEIGGLCYDKGGVSLYGPHTFHTDRKELWMFVNTIDHFIPIHQSPLAQYGFELYSFPINLLTLHQLGLHIKLRPPEGRNFEEACVHSIGEVLYEKFFYHYTKKMWGREPRELPASILKRIPVREDYNTSYFMDRYVGIPEHGYTYFILKLLEGAEVVAGDFVDEYKKHEGVKVFSGSIDDFHYYKHGILPYRGLRFTETKAVPARTINYTDYRKWTRDTNYSYYWGTDMTIRETPADELLRFYPVPWGADLYQRYANMKSDVIFGGRLGAYKYMNMNEVMEQAIKIFKTIYQK
jgi:UDP-galactopyranose mutase